LTCCSGTLEKLSASEHQAGNVTYATGGVSEEEAEAFKQMKGGYRCPSSSALLPLPLLPLGADLYVRWTRGRWPLEQIFPLRGL